MTSSQTRQRILGAALACFTEDGYEQTTIARIRHRSGTSNGALFPHVASFQQGLWELLGRKPDSLHAAVHAAIAHQLSWAEQNADLARFVYQRGHLDWDTPAGAELDALNRELAAAFRAWLAPLVASGEIRATSMLVLTAIVGGPAHAITRRWLTGQVKSPLTGFVDELADAACAGLRGTRVPVPAPPRRVPATGRLTVELLDDDGSVLCRGQAMAPLEAAPGS